MLIDKADMLDALLGNFAGMDLLSDAVGEGSITLGYVTGWLDAIGTLIDAEKKKQDERKALLEQLKQSCARVNAEEFCDTAEQIEEDLEAMNARDDEPNEVHPLYALVNLCGGEYSEEDDESNV